MSALLTYFAAHWALATGTTLAVVALGGAAYVFKNMKFALAAIVVAVAGFMYQGAVMNGVNLQLAKEMAAKVETLNSRIKTLNRADEQNTARAIEDATKIEELEKVANETPANDSACLDRDAASRVRNIR